MSDLPPWYSTAGVALATAVAAAFAAVWHGLWPAGAPNLFAFTALGLLVAFFAVNDTFRAATVRPMDPGLALLEVLLGGAALALMVAGHRLPFLVGAAFLVLLRAVVGSLTVAVVDLYAGGGAEAARRLRRRFTAVALVTGFLLIAFGLGSNLERSPSLLAWGFGPIAVVAGASCLVLLAGAEYEVMQTRFRAGEVTTEPGFGAGWWGPVAGLVAAIVIVSAVAPPLPSFVTLRQVGAGVVQVAERTSTAHNTGPQNLPSSSAPAARKGHPGGLAVSRSEWGLFLFLALVATFLVIEAVRAVRAARRLGVSAYALLGMYAARVRVLGAQALVFFRGLYELVRLGVRQGDWSGLARLLRRWWRWLRDLFGWFRAANRWRRLIPQSADHRPGAAYWAPAGPRTAAGAAWNLPPGDPRRVVRELYRNFLQRARDVGLPRSPGQTPSVYRRAVEAAEPDSAAGLAALTASYEWARYGQRPVSEEHVGAARRGWDLVAAVLGRRPAVAAGSPAGARAGRPGTAGRPPGGRSGHPQAADAAGTGQRVRVGRDFVRRRR